MKRKLTRLSRRYVAVLREHLTRASQASLQSAHKLGCQAAALGVDTAGLVRIHEQALAALGCAITRRGLRQRLERFFAEVIAPIKPPVQLHQRNDKPRQRTVVVLATSQRSLKQGIVRRKTVERALRKMEEHHRRLLDEARQLQEQLRSQTHRIIAEQETERGRVSRELQDEVAQTLLGINVRLLALKKESPFDAASLKLEITSTQRLVEESVKSINRSLVNLTSTGKREIAANRSMKPKFKPARLRKQPNNAACASRSFTVIAMAASAGGLKALSVILGGLPADFPAAIAIVMHLAPDHKSILAEILNSRSLLKVKQVQTGDSLCPSCVFVAPPNHHVSVAKSGRLKLSSSDAEKVHYARPSAEPLFASVAEVYQKNAIGVVLTGGDGDGSFGVQIIKENGGTVIAQDRPTSQDFSMPETSIETGDVDFVLPLKEIAPKLIKLVKGLTLC